MKYKFIIILLVYILSATFVGPAYASYEHNFFLLNPLSNYQINGGYLYGEWDAANPNTAHKGVDSKNTVYGEPVYAAYGGYVENVTTQGGGWGTYVLLRHTYNGRTFYTRYAHLKEYTPGMTIGDYVYPGGQIGQAGNTGTTATHLHFTFERELLSLGKGCRNPEAYLMRSISYYRGTVEGYVKNSSGSFIRSTPSNGCRIYGLPKDDPNYGASYTYGTMNGGTAFGDESEFNVNYFVGKVIEGNGYGVSYTHPNYTQYNTTINVTGYYNTIKNVTLN